MSDWLYTIRERFTENTNADFGFSEYQTFSGFHHIRELVTLDELMCPEVIEELLNEDWNHNVHEDCRIFLFRKASYLMSRQPLAASKHQILGVVESPSASLPTPEGFIVCGYDIMDCYFGNSTLTNCGPIPEAFTSEDVNSFGLIDDRDRAFEIRDRMRKLQPEDSHLGACEVWLVARHLPNEGHSQA